MLAVYHASEKVSYTARHNRSSPAYSIVRYDMSMFAPSDTPIRAPSSIPMFTPTNLRTTSLPHRKVLVKLLPKGLVPDSHDILHILRQTDVDVLQRRSPSTHFHVLVAGGCCVE
ncbi:hypothetical protein Vi05172_g1364 [Venturia inaequalis]|nr:hypothetical protein Vi05172_g1364 [Venturia inaequalis]